MDRLFVLLPLLLLALDFALYPDLFESSYEELKLRPEQLIGKSTVDLGKLNLYRLRVSYGSIAGANFKDDPRLDEKTNALVLAYYGPQVGIGGFGEAVKNRLSEHDKERLEDFLDVMQGLPGGSVKVFEIERHRASGALSRIDYIFVLRLPSGDGCDARDALRDGLRNVFARAGDSTVSGLFLPFLGPSSPAWFDNFFRFFFEALQKPRSARLVDLSFFSGWKGQDRDSAMKSFNDYWGGKGTPRKSGLSGLYRLDLRVLLLSLALCLFVFSFQNTVDLKRFLVLSCTYSLTLLGAFKSIEWIAQRSGEENWPAAAIAASFVTALGFPYFLRWTVKDVFAPARSVAIAEQPREASGEFDVFLAHHTVDKPQVEVIARALRQRGLKPWLDTERIPPGSWFQEVIQQAIGEVKAAAVFIGPTGLGRWQVIELQTFISECIDRRIPVIPVLLPDVREIPPEFPFLRQLNCVRFETLEDPAALENLRWGITRERPGATP